MTEEQQMVQNLAKEYSAPNGTIFHELKTWFPDSENDLWVEYKNKATGHVYSCRLDAFLARYHPHINS